MDELVAKLKTKYPITLSRVHLGRVVRDINITLKQTRLQHVPKTRYKKPIVIKNQIKEFYSKVKQYKLDDIKQAHIDLENRKITGPAIIIP